MPEDVSFPGFSRPRSSRPRSSRPVPGSQHQLLRALNWPGRTTLLQDPSAHVYSVLFLLVYISLVYISLVFISPLFLYLPRTLGLSLLLYSQFPSTHSRPRHLTRHAASANQGSRGKSPPNWIHLYPGTPAQHSRCLCLI